MKNIQQKTNRNEAIIEISDDMKGPTPFLLRFLERSGKPRQDNMGVTYVTTSANDLLEEDY